MINKNEFLRRSVTATLLIGLVMSIAFVFYSCNGDDEAGEPETLVGVYQMQKVELTADYKIGEVTIIPAGTDITVLAADGILSAAPCDNQTNAAIDLRDTGELFIVCIGEEPELKAGTWTENSSLTKLDLNLGSPPFPQALQLSVTNITRGSNSITGEINPLLLPAEAITDLLPPGVPAPPAVLLAVEVTFVKVG